MTTAISTKVLARTKDFLSGRSGVACRIGAALATNRLQTVALRYGKTRVAALLVGLLASLACGAQTKSEHRWTKFVQVDGQPEPVPAEWVSTPEGAFAHSIKIPNPVPKDSGYRRGISAKEYFDLLCREEAGVTTYKEVSGVEGLFFARPPRRPTDEDLMDRYRLEDPYTERFFQLRRADPKERATKFVNPPWYKFEYIEEPTKAGYWNASAYSERFILLSGYVQGQAKMELLASDVLRSRYGVTWRGVKRLNDRENGIAGSELIVFQVGSHDVLGVLRNYVRTGQTRRARDGIWWLNATSCTNIPKQYQDNLGQQFYGFTSTVLKPRNSN